MKSANLSWYFNNEYYDGLFTVGDSSDIISKRNLELRYVNPPVPEIPVLPGESSFDLQVEYPGLLAGLGYHHSAGLTGEIGLGFSLDYVTGLPYLPGSSVKGMLRSAFTHKGYISELLGDDAADVRALELVIFGNRIRHDSSEFRPGGDVFLDAFPIRGDGEGLMELDAITPHKSELEAPVPLTLLKVRPGAVMRFRFLLKDSPELSADGKLALFRQIILDLGAGAKTNVGFGRFTDKIDPPKAVDRETAERDAKPALVPVQEGICRDCGKATKINPKTGKYHPYCFECSKNHMPKGVR